LSHKFLLRSFWPRTELIKTCRMHKNKGIKTKQSGDGIGTTLVSALEVPGNGRWRQPMTLTRSLRG